MERIVNDGNSEVPPAHQRLLGGPFVFKFGPYVARAKEREGEMISLIIRFAIVFACCLFSATPSAALTISADTVWSATTHIVNDSIIILNDATLTIWKSNAFLTHFWQVTSYSIAMMTVTVTLES